MEPKGPRVDRLSKLIRRPRLRSSGVLSTIAGSSRNIWAVEPHCNGVLKTHQRLLKHATASVWERPSDGSNGTEIPARVIKNDHALNGFKVGGTVMRK